MKISTLALLLVLAAGGYTAWAFGRVYVRRYFLQDAIEQQLSYAGQLSEESIDKQLHDKVASMNLPPQASRFHLAHSAPRTLEVSIKYTEKVNLLFTTKEIPVSVTERRSY